jgi:hypothetical protein
MSHQAYDVVDVDDAGTVALPENSGVRPFGLVHVKGREMKYLLKHININIDLL